MRQGRGMVMAAPLERVILRDQSYDMTKATCRICSWRRDQTNNMFAIPLYAALIFSI